MVRFLRVCAIFVVAGLSLSVATHAQQRYMVQGLIANVGQWPSSVLYVAKQADATVWVTRSAILEERNGEIKSVGSYDGEVSVSTGQPVATVSFLKGTIGQSGLVAPVFDEVAIVGPGRQEIARLTVESSGSLRVFKRGRIYSENVQNTSTPTCFVYGSYYGGAGSDKIAGLVFQSNGDVVIAGTTDEITFPGTSDGFRRTQAGPTDGFIARFDRKLQRVKSYTFIGGNADDGIRAICKDKLNNIYVAGETISPDLPTTSGVTGKLYKAGIDAFAMKVDSTLRNLQVCFYHGGNKDDIARAIAVDENGLIYVAGSTTSTTNFPVTFPATVRITIPGRRPQDPPTYRDEPGGGTNMGQTDGFIASFSANGSMQQSRFFGRENVEFFTAMAVDKSPSVYLTGSTTSGNFETAPTSDRFSSGRVPYDRTFNGGTTDAFCVKLNNELALAKTDDGTFSTFWGGSGDEEGRGIFVDDLGRAHVVGVTTSKNLETIGSMTAQAIGDQDIFMAVFSDDGRSLASATYFGGTGKDEVYGVRQFKLPTSAVIYGATSSMDFPVTGEGAISERNGLTDGFIAIINTASNTFTTLVQGADNDTVVAADIDQVGDVYYAASTSSKDLRTHDSAYAAYTDGSNRYIGKLAFGVLQLMSPSAGDVWCVGSTRTISWSSLGFADTSAFYLQCAPEGTQSWTDIKSRVVGRNHQWKIPAMASGAYTLRILSSRGHESLMLSPFFISNPPAIMQQPRNASACSGAPATLTVVAEGAGLKYQWRKGGTDIQGATDSSYTISSVDATTIGQYQCVVTGGCSPSVTSAAASVSLAQATSISSQPNGQVVEQGKSFTLSVAATGSDLQYQWKKDGSAITGATQSTYTIASSALSDAGEYMCEVTGGCGVANSATARVEVTPSTSVTEDVTVDGRSLRLVGPHPASSSVRFVVTDPVGGTYTLEIKDVRGQTVQTVIVGAVLGSTNLDVDVSRLATGVYTVAVRTGDMLLSVPVTIHR